MAVNLKPIKDRVVLEIIEETENKTKGGIILPDTSSKEKPQMGKVVAVGNDEDMKKEIKVGDKVIYPKYSGTEVTMSEVKYLILKFEDVLAIVK
ncbi:MAG: co-chaperone GroES [Candidatus Delongbacteria bacterium]|jgi:chaperonin GroES|nr:co-chaperone GroES [Candidatus Delongbacteria bacterium]MDY0016371.1 co-chaperone GroES [Candidatus Delongbacteria bacterium]